jgi:CheY-like chemotaxis protein
MDADPACRESLAGVRVLAVDDQADAREIIKMMLAGYGAEVMTAASSSEMIEILSKLTPDQLPDVVICDICMPVEDGYAALEKLQAFEESCRIPASEQIPTIALTGYINDQAPARAVAAGFRRHLSKPVEPDELMTVVANLTGRTFRSEDRLNRY